MRNTIPDLSSQGSVVSTTIDCCTTEQVKYWSTQTRKKPQAPLDTMNVERDRGERNSDNSNLDSRFEVRIRKPTFVNGSSSLRRTTKSSTCDPKSSFPERLFGFLECEEFRDAIWWNSDGDAFGIDPKGFTEKLLKKHCQGMKFESFTRSLNRWGFKMVVDECFPNNARVYRHDMFQRNKKPELLQKIKTGKKAEVSCREHLEVVDTAPSYCKGEDLSPPMSSRYGALQSKPLDQQLSQQSGFASEGTPLLSPRDSYILPSRFVAYRNVADHQHQAYPVRTVSDLLAEYRLHRLRQEQAQVCLLEAQKELFATETNLRLLQARKEQERARLAHFSHISNSSRAHLALHSLQDVSRVPCGVLGVQRVMQSSMVNPALSSQLLNSTPVAQTAAQATNQVGSSDRLVVEKRSRPVSEQDASVDDSKNDCAEKRRRIVDGGPGDSTTQKRRIGSYCTGKWEENLQELMRYRQRTGNCLVPNCYKENPTLARWVKRQRYQYTLMIEGQPSSAMTGDRVAILEEAGFVWDSQAASWEERLEELKAFRKTQRHCNVPTGYSENISLGNWVKRQRRQYMFLNEGRKSNMTTQRIHDLESIGFEWKLRPSRYTKKKNLLV
jgi:hypothetical protein